LERPAFRNVISLAGAFVTSDHGTATAGCDKHVESPGSLDYINSYACYLYSHHDRGIVNWSFHDYVDTKTSGCNTTGSWEGCSAYQLSRFQSTLRATHEVQGPKIYITETGCAYWPSGGGCHNGHATVEQSASAGEEFEYLSRMATVVIWYSFGYDGNSGWDSAMVNNDGTARPQWCVLDGYTYAEAVSSLHCTVSAANGHGSYGA
jgi:hypothetical protein